MSRGLHEFSDISPAGMEITLPCQGGKGRQLFLLALAELLAMSLWFSASAVVPQLTAEWRLGDAARSWMTMSVQAGFVAGALLSALASLADRLPARNLFAGSALAGALANAAIPLVDGPGPALLLRFVTGAALAGVYPPGMKMAASWCRKDRGLGIGLLVGALTLGSASPHLLNAVFSGWSGPAGWRSVLMAASGMAATAGIIAVLWLREGPYLGPSPRFNWRLAWQSMAERPVRLANYGYLGHMWELYAMWAWVPALLLASFSAAGWSREAAHLAGFGVIAVGAAGCVIAGAMADRLGRTRVTIWSLGASGCCALLAGFFFSRPLLLTLVCLIWGFAVVADSAQFSAAVAELADPGLIGTALTVQTCLGFLLTLGTIRLLPVLIAWIGWEWAFAVLAVGPAFGICSMLALRRLPEAARMASGKR